MLKKCESREGTDVAGASVEKMLANVLRRVEVGNDAPLACSGVLQRAVDVPRLKPPSLGAPFDCSDNGRQ